MRNASARENQSPFLAWGDFHARSLFARSTIPEEKWGTIRSLVRDKGFSFAKLLLLSFTLSPLTTDSAHTFIH